MNIRSKKSQDLLYDLNLLFNRLEYLSEAREFVINRLNEFKFAKFKIDDHYFKDYSRRNADLKIEIFEVLDKIEVIIREIYESWI